MKEKQEKLKEDEQRNSVADTPIGYGLNYTAYLDHIKDKNQHLDSKMLSKFLENI